MAKLQLPLIKLPWSTPVKRLKRPGLLIAHRAMGTKVDAVVTDFVEAVKGAAGTAPMHVGLTWDATQEPGKMLSIRVVDPVYPNHPVAVDVLFKAQGQDLYVKREVLAKTFVAHYQKTLFAVAFAALWLVLYAVLMTNTGAKHALGVSFAQKYFPNNPAAGEAVLVQGWDINTNKEAILANSSITNVFRKVTPWSLTDYVSTDPVLFVQSLASVPTILAAMVGAILVLVPRHVYRKACLSIGWPAPEDFESTMIAHQAWVERVFFDMILLKHNVTKTDVIELDAN